MNWHSIRPSALALVAAPLLLGIGAFSPPGHGQTISACPTIVNAPGSWIVTKNLTATRSCIIIAANGAAIDLKGHTITGSTTKEGSNWGVGEEGGNFSSIIIHNGTIRNFEYGILLETTTNATIAKINAIGNGSGIVAFTPVVITDTIASNNTYGLYLTNTNNKVSNSQASQNRFYGMYLFPGGDD